jgi:hypothetical protein
VSVATVDVNSGGDSGGSALINENCEELQVYMDE